MKRAELIKREIRKYGKTITVDISDEKMKGEAVILPLLYKNKMYLELDITELGLRDNSKMLYIGPYDIDFTKDWSNVTISDSEYSYSVSRADMIYIGNEPIYVWAVLSDRRPKQQ